MNPGGAHSPAEVAAQILAGPEEDHRDKYIGTQNNYFVWGNRNAVAPNGLAAVTHPQTIPSAAPAGWKTWLHSVSAQTVAGAALLAIGAGIGFVVGCAPWSDEEPEPPPPVTRSDSQSDSNGSE